jgi:hypothetical protein
MNSDEEHLRLLSIFHYVVGGLGCLFSCMPILHIVIGLMIIVAPEKMGGNNEELMPEFAGWMFFLMGMAFFIIGQAISIAIIVSGRFISKRKNYMYSFIIACVECLFIPFGTVLGVFSIIVLSKETVKKIYSLQRNSP